MDQPNSATSGGLRASTVIVHTVPPANVERYLARQREIQAAAAGSPGFQRTDVYPPEDPQGTQWVVILHFDTPASLEAWMTSPVRAEWIKKVRAEGLDFRVAKMPRGLGAWLAGAADNLPPAWKIVLTVLLGLYPTVMLLTIFVSPWTTPHLGLAGALLIGNAMSVSLMQWVVMPLLNRIVDPWLKTPSLGSSLAGTAAITGVLVALAALFALKTG